MGYRLWFTRVRAGAADRQRVAVGRRARGDFGADDAARAAAVLHDDLLPERRAERRGHEARREIDEAARRKADDDAHRLGGIAFGGGGR